MGAIWFDKRDFADHLHEIIGYKSGVAASIEQMCDLLSGTGFDDEIVSSEEHGIRIRSEDYDTLYRTYRTSKTLSELQGSSLQGQSLINNDVFLEVVSLRRVICMLHTKTAVTRQVIRPDSFGHHAKRVKSFNEVNNDITDQTTNLYI